MSWALLAPLCRRRNWDLERLSSLPIQVVGTRAKVWIQVCLAKALTFYICQLKKRFGSLHSLKVVSIFFLSDKSLKYISVMNYHGVVGKQDMHSLRNLIHQSTSQVGEKMELRGRIIDLRSTGFKPKSGWHLGLSSWSQWPLTWPLLE